MNDFPAGQTFKMCGGTKRRREERAQELSHKHPGCIELLGDGVVRALVPFNLDFARPAPTRRTSFLAPE